jgi:Helix-turn-helix domain of resolvase
VHRIPAEFERELIRARIGEGRARARARGVKMGRPPKLTPHQIKEALRRRDAGEPMRDIARTLQCLPQHDFEAGGLRCQGRGAAASNVLASCSSEIRANGVFGLIHLFRTLRQRSMQKDGLDQNNYHFSSIRPLNFPDWLQHGFRWAAGLARFPSGNLRNPIEWL